MPENNHPISAGKSMLIWISYFTTYNPIPIIYSLQVSLKLKAPAVLLLNTTRTEPKYKILS